MTAIVGMIIRTRIINTMGVQMHRKRAAHNCGLKFIAFENDDKNYKIAESRVKAETSQMNLFDFIGDTE